MSDNGASQHNGTWVDVAPLVDVEHGLLNRRVFADEQIYRQELEQIFARCWLYLGHETQLPNPHDYFTTTMGEDPVIVTRDQDGHLRAFHNSCRHRGMTVCPTDAGHARVFRCPYHYWTYGTDGKLIGVPREKELYGGLDKARWGLIEVAQLDTFAGLIFATWDPEAPPLRDYLGDMAYYLDIILNRSEGGTEVIPGPHRWVVQANWKIPAENFAGDLYHIAGLHSPMVHMNMRGPMGHQGYCIHTAGGHSFAAEFGGTYQGKGNEIGYLAHMERLKARVAAEKGEAATKLIPMGVSLTFPNLMVMDSAKFRFIRVLHPRGPGATELHTWAVVDKALSPELKRETTKQIPLYTSAAGLFVMDDEETWTEAMTGARGVIGARYPLNYQLGLGGEIPVSESEYFKGSGMPGEMNRTWPDEGNMRNFHRRWRDLMSGSAWKDLPPATTQPAASRNGGRE